MFEKIDNIYKTYNIYKSIIITSNEEEDIQNMKKYLDDNFYTSIVLDYHNTYCISNIKKIKNFKIDCNRIIIMSYTTWYYNMYLISETILSDINLIIVGSIIKENIERIYLWMCKNNNKSHFLELNDEII